MTAEPTPAPVTEAVDAATAAVTTDPTAAADAATTAVAPVADAAHAAAHHAVPLADVFNTLGSNVIYLMGFSFILGSLFTVLILVLLDYLRRNKS
jgi:hypothetical protein